MTVLPGSETRHTSSPRKHGIACGSAGMTEIEGYRDTRLNNVEMKGV
jgi:hypothetical protein